MIYEDYLSHITRRYANTIKLQSAELSQLTLTNQFESQFHQSEDDHHSSLNQLASPFLEYQNKKEEERDVQHKIQKIQCSIEEIKEDARLHGQSIQEEKKQIEKIGSLVSVGCCRQIENIRKMGQKINAVKVVDQYIGQYFQQMGCETPLLYLIAFISDFYSDQIVKKFKPLCRNLSEKYNSLKEQSQNQEKISQVNETIEKYENRLDAVIHQLQAANKNKMNLIIDKEILLSQLQSLERDISEKQQQIGFLIESNVRRIVEEYMNEYNECESKREIYAEDIQSILCQKINLKINKYIEFGMEVNQLKKHIRSDGQTIERLEDQLVAKSHRIQSEYLQSTMRIENYTTFNHNGLEDTSQFESSKRKKYGVFKVCRKICITNSELEQKSKKKNKENNFQYQFSYLLSFEKKFMILQKKNPHFHEQIQIKRIKKVKVVNSSTAYLYFKKGYLHLHFLHQDSKSWAECFVSHYSQDIPFDL